MAAREVVETLVRSGSVTRVTRVTPIAGLPAQATKLLAGIAFLPGLAENAGREDVELQRPFARHLDRSLVLAFRAGEQHPAERERFRQRNRLEVFGDLRFPHLRQDHVLPSPIVDALAEAGTVDDLLARPLVA